MSDDDKSIRARVGAALGWWAAIMPSAAIRRLADLVKLERIDAYYKGRTDQQLGRAEGRPS